MFIVSSFPPVFREDARVLVLGSMPGVASLSAGQYYAHPRNAFWPIMGTLLGAGPQLPYADRLHRLQDAGVALWDVIAHCERPGSLDSAITPASVIANDLPGLLAICSGIRHVFFNGSAAEAAFRRHVQLPAGLAPLQFMRLPSTSPAHAARSLTEKIAAWGAVAAALGRPLP
ncbi:DNA-deoxyinosine glycosylase [Azoarcus sp. TTM-91]|uniref:DNA-deoxyinosine glycosylase n=1 Tax=Azoarcus sp. TTM-91 TaxID=2691581 RepID=UPI00145FCA22|nr:DNA-deoxyinosine glycosylase [Azoarcus sp. TTM-91]NMG33867.1 DNA-deoxyinosine glycosylase [Azoarcus sp. TTM-91]